MAVQATRLRREILIDEAAYAVIVLFGSFFLFIRFGAPWAFLGPPALAITLFAVRVPLKLRGRLRRDYSARGWIKRGVALWVGIVAFFIFGVDDPDRWRFAVPSIAAITALVALTTWMDYRRSRPLEDPVADYSRSVRQISVLFLAVVALLVIVGAVLSQID